MQLTLTLSRPLPTALTVLLEYDDIETSSGKLFIVLVLIHIKLMKASIVDSHHSTCLVACHVTIDSVHYCSIKLVS